MRRMYYVTTLIIVLIISYLGITYSFVYENDNEVVSFELLGPASLYVDVNSEYIEYGVKVFYQGNDISKQVVIDNSSVNMNKLGQYRVKYSVNVMGVEEYVYRDVKVIDTVSPVIELLGDEKLYVLLNGIYMEEGYTVTDNYDENLLEDVRVEGKVDVKKEGSYYLTYLVRDSSGNEAMARREVVVKKSEVTLASMDGNKRIVSTYDYSKYANTVITNIFNSDGVYIEGYNKDVSSIYRIKLKRINDDLEYLYNMTVSKNNYYKGNIDLTTVKNGEYEVYIIGSKEQKLLNKLNGLTRLLRGKVGSKLITFEYDNDAVKVIVDDFKYEYDILIDPGHGGGDPGASNGVMLEKTMNLKQSLYEKCRYESMGYRVLMIRSNDSDGLQLGDKSLLPLQRRALAIGYYGVVSRVVYSNHHNASKSSSAHGFEIIVPNSVSVDDIIVETSLYNRYKKYYTNISGVRLYSKNLDNDVIYNKLYGSVYNATNYYAVIRIPYELFNVKTVIYEPIYMSNISDYNWYWTKKNWIQVTEMKIEEYVNYLGGTYNKDNKSCL